MTITPHNRGSIISTRLYTNWLVLSSLTQIAVVKSDAQYLFNTYSTFTITWDNAILLQHEDPTLKEIEECYSVNLTYEYEKWEPCSPVFGEEERINESNITESTAGIASLC